jgi:hypothetical protein
MKKIEKIILEIWIEFVFEFWKKWPCHQREMEKLKKNQFWNLKKMAIPPEGNEKNEICHENLKWKSLKIEMENFENFRFWKLEGKFPFEICKKVAIYN